MSATSRVLLFTVSRANTPEQVSRAVKSLLRAHEWIGIPPEQFTWRLYRNAPGVPVELPGFDVRGTGENVGQHIPLAEVIDDANTDGYDYIVKVDDDLEWLTKRWLRKLLLIEDAAFKLSGKRCVFSPVVRGLKNPIPIAERVRIGDQHIPLLLTPILGGACRLHRTSFFDGYNADCRRAMGAGGDTTIAEHAAAIKVSMFACPWVRVRHATRRMEDADPAYFTEHDIFQHVPYIPPYDGPVVTP